MEGETHLPLQASPIEISIACRYPGERLLFLIKAGRVKLAKLSEDGAEITLDIRKAGDFIGETVLSETR